jgi:hypothetical protein
VSQANFPQYYNVLQCLKEIMYIYYNVRIDNMHNYYASIRIYSSDCTELRMSSSDRNVNVLPSGLYVGAAPTTLHATFDKTPHLCSSRAKAPRGIEGPVLQTSANTTIFFSFFAFGF